MRLRLLPILLLLVSAAPVHARAPFVRGDFNGDGKTDIIWRQGATGENLIWIMNGATLHSFAIPAALPDTNWRMVGTHDFNADNKTDILWRHEVSGQNVVWYMDGGALISGTFLTPSSLSDPNWKMAGTGDFNSDGKPDIVWHHRTAGQIVVWYMNGNVLMNGTFTNPSTLPDTGWQLVGVADFSIPADQKPDLVWRHQASGENAIWYMDGVNRTAGTFTSPSVIPDTNWKIAGVGDYNQDTQPDLLWHHQGSGQIVIWYMNGVELIAGVFTTPSVIADTNWKIAGPR